MSSGVELATGWLRLVPSVEGIQEAVSKEFLGAGEAAGREGDKAGGLFGGKFGSAVKGALAIGAVVGATKGLYEVGAVFDDVADTIRIGTGASGRDLEGLIDVAKQVGTSIPTSFEAAGSTVADLNTRLGLSGDTLSGVAQQYLEAGRILNEEVDIGATSAAFSAFKIEGDAVSGAMDDLFRVSQATGVGMNALAAGVQAQAPALQTLGFSFEDSISLLGSLDKAGLNSTAVMASMSKGMVTLAKDGEEPAQAFQRTVAELQGFVDTGETAAALDLASKVFGTKGAAQFVGALESGAIGMDDLMAATGATGDTILGVASDTNDFAEKWQITMNKATAAIEPLASAIFDGLGQSMDDIMPGLEAFGSWLGENDWVLRAAAGVIGGVLVAAFVSWTAAIVANSVAWLASPITWIILGIVAAIGLLVAAGVWLVQNWDGIVAWLGDLWAGFLGWMTGALDGFGAWWTEMWLGFGAWIQEVWLGFTAWITELWTGFVGWLMGALTGLASWWTGFWGAIGLAVSNVWNEGIVGPIRSALAWMTSAIQNGLSLIDSAWRNTWNGLGSIVRNVWNGILGWIQGGVNGAIGIINNMISGVNVVGGAFGLEIALIPKVNIPRLAKGATILPSEGGTLAVLAEAGKPETVVDTGKMNALMDMALAGGGRGGGDTYNITVPGSEHTADQLADAIKRAIRYELKGA